MPMVERVARRALALLFAVGMILLAAPPPSIEACGPIFPNQLLLDARGAALNAPAADFRRELVRIAERHGLEATHPLAYVDPGFEPEATTATIEALEIKALLEHEGHHPLLQRHLFVAQLARTAVAQPPWVSGQLSSP